MLTPTSVHTGDIGAWTRRAALQGVFSMLLTSAKPLLQAPFSHCLAGGGISQDERKTIDVPAGAEHQRAGRGFCVTAPALL